MGKSKKSRRKKLIVWLCIDAVVAATVIALLLYKPALYHPVAPPVVMDPNGQEVHPYITHNLVPTLYNNAQEQKPFVMEVLAQGLNEAIAQTGWRQQSGAVALSSPAIAFAPGRIVLMGTADIEGAECVVTVEIEPQILADKRLNLMVKRVSVGAMPITLLAKVMAKKMYREQVDAGLVDAQDWRTKIAASLLVDEPFEPVFPVEDKWIRLESFDIGQDKATLRFVPAPRKVN
ncbi:MAG: hypothetical protein ACM3VT_07900 [Solirubrobacterales bacterium]